MGKRDGAEDVMNRLKKDWADLAARSQVSEVGLDVDRAELIRRYHEDDGLSPKEIADGLELTTTHIGRLLIYGRYVRTSPIGDVRISETRFRAYWQQVSDPKLTRGRRQIDPEYEAGCFADIRKLVGAGKPPLKKKPKVKPVTSEDIRGVADVRKAARKVYAKLRPELDRLKRLLNADRATYAPDILAASAVVIDREIKALFKVLAHVGENVTEHGLATAASAGN